jgi:ADP-heptose:LPS heptosyltransferase
VRHPSSVIRHPSSVIRHPSSRDAARRLALQLVARLLPSAPPLQGRPRRLLLIRPDHFGDVLLASPAIAALRQARPEAHISLLVGPWSLEVARRGAQVDEILTCEFPGFTRRPKRHPLEPYQLLLREARRRRGRYDLALILRPDHWWGALLAALAAIPLRLGWDTPTTRPFLSEALPPPPAAHAARLNLMLAERAAEVVAGARTERSPAATDGPRLDLPDHLAPIFRLTPEERAWAAELAERAGGPLILLHPGSGSQLKNWPADRWAAVVDALAERGACVVLTGGPDDPASPRAVAAAMRARPLVLAGATTLGQLGALAERCALALGTDNGPLHLAAALGAPTLRLYGPTDPAIFGPWGSAADHLVLTHQLPCRPCGNLIAPPCTAHQEPPCLLGIETERVAEAALARFAVASRRSCQTVNRSGCHSERSEESQ